jgi:hypothetical protein
MSTEELLADVLKLPREERARLAEVLVSSLVGPEERTASIPKNELWLHEPSVARKLDRAIARAERDPNPPKETNLEELEAKLFARFGPKPGARRQRRK